VAAEEVTDPTQTSRVKTNNARNRGLCMAIPLSMCLSSRSITNSWAQRHAIVARGAQFGGVSPVNGIGVAPVTVPMVGLIADEELYCALKAQITLHGRSRSDYDPGTLRTICINSLDGFSTRMPPSTCDAPVMFMSPLTVLIPPPHARQ